MNRLILILLLFAAANIIAQPFTALEQQPGLTLAPPAVFQEGLLGFANPANLGLLHSFDAKFAWTTRDNKTIAIDN
jgi:hypothetical protein